MSRRYVVQCDFRFHIEVSANSQAEALALAEKWPNYLAWLGLMELVGQDGIIPPPPDAVMGFLIDELPEGKEFPEVAVVRPGRLEIPPGVQAQTLALFDAP